jgi:hypothetical protein
VPQFSLLRIAIKLGSSISEVFLIHDIIAVKHRPCLPSPILMISWTLSGADFGIRFCGDRERGVQCSAGTALPHSHLPLQPQPIQWPLLPQESGQKKRNLRNEYRR